jgi:hypothetical protein
MQISKSTYIIIIKYNHYFDNLFYKLSIARLDIHKQDQEDEIHSNN